VVESPAKAKTINNYLGPNFRVLASYGHVRDLDTHKKKGEPVAGIDIANGWKLRYTVDDGSGDEGKGGKRFRSAKQILDEIGRAAAQANRVYLASDPDREGESIAWHIADELKLPAARTFRIRFNEITKTAVNKALAEADKINDLKVQAQEARRAMDRVVGFPLSNLLGKKVAARLSAGRVQSVAVKLIVDREREIEAFKTEEYWKITALLAKAGAGVAWTADPAKSKILAKKKDAPAKPVEWHKPTEDDTAGDRTSRSSIPRRATRRPRRATRSRRRRKRRAASPPRRTRRSSRNSRSGTAPTRSSPTRPRRMPSLRRWRACRSS